MPDLHGLEAKAEQVAALLSEMANAKRLLVLCTLLGGEASAGALSAAVGLTPAALSQHLARMRVSYRPSCAQFSGRSCIAI